MIINTAYFCNITYAFPQKKYSKEEIIKNSRVMQPTDNYWGRCYYLNTITFEEEGFITLHFKHNNKIMGGIPSHSRYCPENVLYDVKVLNDKFQSTKIIGAKGVNGRNSNKEFWIQVSPDTARISLSILKNKNVATETWRFGDKLKN